MCAFIQLLQLTWTAPPQCTQTASAQNQWTPETGKAEHFGDLGEMDILASLLQIGMNYYYCIINVQDSWAYKPGFIQTAHPKMERLLIMWLNLSFFLCHKAETHFC